jgi:hypothetical protein
MASNGFADLLPLALKAIPREACVDTPSVKA